MKRVIIFGNNEVASVNHYYLTHDSEYDVAAFTIDKEFLKEDMLRGLPVIPFDCIESLYPPETHAMALPLGFRKLNRFRAEKYQQAKSKGYELISYVSSRATVWKDLKVGENCFIYENCIVGPHARIGDNVILNPGCHVGHDSRIGDHCWISSCAVILGGVEVEPFCVIGGNATIIDRVTVKAECIVGAGVTITRNTVERGVYVNTPPALVPKRSDELSALLTWPYK